MAHQNERIPVNGMHCSSCETVIEKELRHLKGIAEVKANFKEGWVDVKYNPKICNLTAVHGAIIEAGYTVGRSSSSFKLAGIFMVVAAIILLSNITDTFDIGSEVQQNLTFAALFMIGLFTSLHCIGMCGGIMFSQSLAGSSPNQGKLASLLPSLLYNLGRVIAYSLLGGLVGAVGSVFSLTPTAKATIMIIAALLMVVMGLGLAGMKMFRFSFRLPWAGLAGKTTNNRPFVVGFLNGFMPCGPLQTMQLYALGTSSFIAGATSMLAFSLGTVPLMLFFGAFTGFISKTHAQKIVRFSGVLIAALGLIMLNRGLAITGMSPVNMLASTLTVDNKPTAPAATGQTNKAEIKNGVQTLRMSANRMGYVPNILYVQKGIPVKWIITGEQLNTCNNEIIVPSLKIQQRLAKGETVIEFTPGDKDINFSCWMGMIGGAIRVVDNLETVPAQATQAAQAPRASIYGDDWRKVPTARMIKKAQVSGESQKAVINGIGYEFEPLVIVVNKDMAAKLVFDMSKFDIPDAKFTIVNESNNVISRIEAKTGINEIDFKQPAGIYDILRNNRLAGLIVAVDDVNSADLEQLRKKFFKQ